MAREDFLARGYWHEVARLTVKPGETLRHVFPDGFATHWVRLVASRDCRVTGTFVYE